MEFTAEEGTCYLPFNMFDRLCLEEGQKVNIRALKIAPGTFIKIQPHKTEFMNNPQAKSILKYNLNTNYFCVTEGDTISVKLGDEYYKLDILECKPNKGIRIINSSNLIIDFAPPKDYKEPEHKKANKNVIEANIKEKEEKNQDIHINNEEEGPKGNIELKINEIEKNIKEKNDNLLRNENEKINKLLNENEKFREEVLNLNKKISQLENSIKKLNTENNSLNKNNINYTKEIEQLKTENSNLLDKLKYLSNIQNNNNREILLMEKLEKKDNVIKKFKEFIPFDLNDGEELLTIILISSNEIVHHAFICKSTENFRSLEDRIYAIYPQYEKIEKQFTVNGRKIEEFKTLKENGIKNNDIITMKI